MFDRTMKHISVRLDDKTIELAKVLGDGNLSEGLRTAVRWMELAKAGRLNRETKS